jgi:hypothetical protein
MYEVIEGFGDGPGVGEVGGEVDGNCAAEEGGVCECHFLLGVWEVVEEVGACGYYFRMGWRVDLYVHVLQV